jgi:hypothetical protein
MYGSLIFKKEGLRQVKNKAIYDGVLSGENDAIISVNNEKTINPKEKTWFHSTLFETLPKKALGAVFEPVVGGLFAPIQVAL